MTVIGLDISGRSPDAMVNDRRRLIRHQFLQYDRASSQWAQGSPGQRRRLSKQSFPQPASVKGDMTSAISWTKEAAVKS